jgi:hypothetical protein
MAPAEIAYLALIIGAFSAFAVALATVEAVEKRKLRRQTPRAQRRAPELGNALPA